MKKIILFLVAFAMILEADVWAKEKKEKELPKEGVLVSSIGNAGNVDVKSPETWGGVSLDGASSAPIQAGVSPKGGSNYVLTVKNSSQDKYNVKLRVSFLTEAQKILKTGLYTMSLKPNETKEMPITANQFAKDYVVKLVSWKKIKVKKNKKEEKKKEEISVKENQDEVKLETDAERFYKDYIK